MKSPMRVLPYLRMFFDEESMWSLIFRSYDWLDPTAEPLILAGTGLSHFFSTPTIPRSKPVHLYLIACISNIALLHNGTFLNYLQDGYQIRNDKIELPRGITMSTRSSLCFETIDWSHILETNLELTKTRFPYIVRKKRLWPFFCGSRPLLAQDTVVKRKGNCDICEIRELFAKHDQTVLFKCQDPSRSLLCPTGIDEIYTG